MKSLGVRSGLCVTVPGAAMLWEDTLKKFGAQIYRNKYLLKFLHIIIIYKLITLLFSHCIEN